jgi:hypothetical protein
MYLERRISYEGRYISFIFSEENGAEVFIVGQNFKEMNDKQTNRGNNIIELTMDNGVELLLLKDKDRQRLSKVEARYLWTKLVDEYGFKRQFIEI